MNLNFRVELEEITCPNNCISPSEIVMTDKDRLHNLNGSFSIVRCMGCGLERTSPRPTSNSIGYYYPKNYGPYIDIPYSDFETKSNFKNKLISFLKLNSRQLPKIGPTKMLEIGCSTGNYMEYIRKKGWIVDGIEFSSDAAQIAINKGFDVKIGQVEDVILTNAPYDLIVAWMVMEHLHDPISTLNKIKTWLKKDGYFIFLVPDNKSISRRLFKNLSFDTQLPTHLFHYNENSLKFLLKENGWKIEKIFYQRNCNTFLKSIELWCNTKNLFQLQKMVNKFNNSKRTKLFRILLALIFGLTKQSGRIEITARPF